MGLKSIHIKNYKSIHDLKINLKEMTLLLGENGSGKTNVLSAISYFYANLISQNPQRDIFDNNNKLNDKIVISLTYDMSKILIRIRSNRKNGNSEKYSSYYKIIEKIQKNGKIVLTLTQIKNGNTYWNYDRDTRKVIYNLYPLYQLDGREINLTDWEELWENIGDFIKQERKISKIQGKQIQEIILKTDPRLETKIEIINHIFEQLELEPSKFSIKEFSSYMAKMYYGGEEFKYKAQDLSLYSNGTNTINYMKLLLHILRQMGKSKLKEPILLMDEPEISLHFQMIDELSELLLECSADINVILTTHSPRIVKNVLIKEEDNSIIYQMYKKENISEISSLNLFKKDKKGIEKERFVLTEHHANAFFAKILLLVEGETELELFQNRYLKKLFPVLKDIELIKGMSDNVVYRIVDTNTRHYNVPMITLMDMDKVLSWDVNRKRMIWNKEQKIFSFSKKENYYYGARRNEIFFQRKRIQAICDKCRFLYKLPFFSTDDTNYKQLVEIVKKYYANYDIFIASTTIEGLLINEKNYFEVIDYLKNRKKWDKVEEVYQTLRDDREKINFIRLIFSGKSDLLMSINQIEKEFEQNGKRIGNYQKIYDVIKQNHIAKTSWVSDWFQYYFSKKTGIPEENMTLNNFSKYCESNDNIAKLKNHIQEEFYELYELLKCLERIG